MPTLACTPRRLVLLALCILAVTVIYFSDSRYAEYLPKHSPLRLGQDGGNTGPKNEPPGDAHPDAQHVDVQYLAATFGLSEPSLQQLIDAPTTQSVKDLLQSLGKEGQDYNALKAGKLEVEKLKTDLAEQHRGTESPPKPKPPVEQLPMQEAPSYKSYDPTRPEQFEWDSDFYIQNGIKLLQNESDVQPVLYWPYPNYNSDEWKGSWRGDYVTCRSARGKPLNDSLDDLVQAYGTLPKGFPKVSLGDAGMSRLQLNHCFDRYHRYGPYGFGHGRHETVEGWQRPSSAPDWSAVSWYQLQDQCIAANQNRYLPSTRHPIDLKFGKGIPAQLPQLPPAEQTSGPRYHHRTAVLLRTSHEYRYTENDLQNIRAMITELSLISGGEYQVFNLVHVQDNDVDIFGNPQDYDDVLRKIPKELRGISILWNDEILQEWYPKVGQWDGTFHSSMPLQWFIVNHPEFDFVWNWEMNVRFTGNFYELLEGVATYARVIPRKHMWERNQRVFVPHLRSDKDYTYDKFLVEIDDIIQKATQESQHQSIWGAHPYDANAQHPIGPSPPSTYEGDGFQWGSGDDADLITLQPIFDPSETSWEHKNNIWNFFQGIRPIMDDDDPKGAEDFHQYYGQIPRRASVGTVVRLSKRQLYAMHLENLEGRAMHPEMWAATVALHHGLKAVYAPHPIWTNRIWTPDYLNGIFNADHGEATRWSSTPGSVFDADRVQNFDGLTWGVEGDFAKTLYRRWMGWTSTESDGVPGIGGETWEREGMQFKLKDRLGSSSEKVDTLVGGRGRMCLPPVLLHPVGDVYEAAEDKSELGGVYG